jgi:hypothetical protein
LVSVSGFPPLVWNRSPLVRVPMKPFRSFATSG